MSKQSVIFFSEASIYFFIEFLIIKAFGNRKCTTRGAI